MLQWKKIQVSIDKAPLLRESYELLGIDENAPLEVIIKSHKELIRKLHPDKGGSSYLSARVNEARDIILAEKEKRE